MSLLNSVCCCGGDPCSCLISGIPVSCTSLRMKATVSTNGGTADYALDESLNSLPGYNMGIVLTNNNQSNVPSAISNAYKTLGVGVLGNSGTCVDGNRGISCSSNDISFLNRLELSCTALGWKMTVSMICAGRDMRFDCQSFATVPSQINLIQQINSAAGGVFPDLYESYTKGNKTYWMGGINTSTGLYQKNMAFYALDGKTFTATNNTGDIFGTWTIDSPASQSVSLINYCTGTHSYTVSLNSISISVY